MTVDLKPEQQQIVERAIAAGIVSTVGGILDGCDSSTRTEWAWLHDRASDD